MEGQKQYTFSAKGAGAQLWGPGGDRYEILAGAAQTAGTNLTLLANVPVGGGPPLHAHQFESESFYMLDGDLTFTIDGNTVPVSQGEFVFIPKGVFHTYQNRGDKVARALVSFSPSGMQGWFQEVLVPVKSPSDQPYDYSPAQLDFMIQAGPKHGVIWA